MRRWWRRRRGSEAEPHATYDALGRDYAAFGNQDVGVTEHERPGTRALVGDVEGLRVLDAGCGPGWWVEHLRAEGAAHVTAFDAAPSQVEEARGRVGQDEGVDLRVHDLREPLDWMPSESVDLALSALVLAHVEDWGPLLAELFRVLRPGGRFVFSIEHPFAEFMRPSEAGYHATESIEVRWRKQGRGAPPSVLVWRRPLQAVTDALLDAGFRLERLLEPRPTEAHRVRTSEKRYRRASTRPVWLCVAAEKPREVSAPR